MRIAVPIGIALLFGALLLLSNHHITTPEGVEIIYDQPGYIKTLTTARQISEPIFEAYDKGIEPTDAQREELRKAALMYDAANRFEPTSMEPYYAAGKAYQILGEYESADQRLRQLVFNQIYFQTKAGEDTVTEAKNLLSIVRGLEGQWPSALALAEEAVKAHPDSPTYHTTRASAEYQLKLTASAKQDLSVALTLDPKYARAIRLAKLVGMDSARPARG